MKYIRSIIDERATLSARSPGADGQPSTANRTYTRVRPEADPDDLVQRLLKDDDSAPLADDPLDRLLDDDDGADNLFHDDAEDMGEVDQPEPVERSVLPHRDMPAASTRSAEAEALFDSPPTTAPAARIEVPAPASGRSAQQGAGRVKTRLLGFNADDMATRDPFAQPGPGPEATRYPVGWLVIVAGPGRGHAFTLSPGVSQIGRGEDMTIRLDFGDTAISRNNHAAVAYDPEERAFFLGHGGKANMVRLNNRPVLSTETLTHGAHIRIGETTLRFVAFCDASFDWDKDGASEHASRS